MPQASSRLLAAVMCGLLGVTQLCLISKPAVAQSSGSSSSTKSAPDAGSENSGKLPRVQLDGTYFSTNGHRFLPVGVHWVPAKAAMHWPVQWDPKEVEADFAKMREMGFNTVRIDLMWAWFEPRPGDYNPEAFQQLDYLISLAHRYQIYLHPTLFIGGEVGEAYWDVPWRHGRHPHADPEMLRLQTEHAAQFGRRYASESAIIAWDLTDEPPYWIVAGNTTDAMAVNWTRLIAGAIRRYDTAHPIVVGTSTEDISRGPFRPDNIVGEVDFFSVHPYTIYVPDLYPDPMLSERGTYGAAFQTALSASMGRPAMVQEMGASSAQYTPERIAAYDRANLYSSLAAGSNGFLLWCFTDAAPQQYSKVPYLRSPHETQFGLTTWDRKDRPQGTEFKKFAQVVAQMDLAGVEPILPDGGIIVPYGWSRPHGDYSKFGLTGPEVIPYVATTEGGAIPTEPLPGASDANQWLRGSWLSAFVLGSRAGLKLDFPREYSDWAKRRMLFLPSPLTSTSNPVAHVHSDFWEKARNYVSQGGVLYASVSADAAIPEMEQLFGARLADAVPVSELTLKIVEAFGDLKPGDTFSFTVPGLSARTAGALLEVKGAKVIAVDQDGRAALVANTVGSGKVLLSAYPIESYLANTPAVFERPEQTHRIYRAFAAWAGHKPQFRTNQPSVEVSGLSAADRGYAVLTNHSAQSQKVTVSTTLPIRSLFRVTPERRQALHLEGSGWTMELGPYEGAVVEWK